MSQEDHTYVHALQVTKHEKCFPRRQTIFIEREILRAHPDILRVESLTPNLANRKRGESKARVKIHLLETMSGQNQLNGIWTNVYRDY